MVREAFSSIPGILALRTCGTYVTILTSDDVKIEKQQAASILREKKLTLVQFEEDRRRLPRTAYRFPASGSI